jgi:hypothetical protein
VVVGSNADHLDALADKHIGQAITVQPDAGNDGDPHWPSYDRLFGCQMQMISFRRPHTPAEPPCMETPQIPQRAEEASDAEDETPEQGVDRRIGNTLPCSPSGSSRSRGTYGRQWEGWALEASRTGELKPVLGSSA